MGQGLDKDNECLFFWTPYVYSQIEGIVKNENTAVKEKLLWLSGFPVNHTERSEVLFSQERGNFINHAPDYEACLVCNTSLKTSYTMRGNCKYSLLGNLKYSAHMNNKYLAFFGDSVIIW